METTNIWKIIGLSNYSEPNYQLNLYSIIYLMRILDVCFDRRLREPRLLAGQLFGAAACVSQTGCVLNPLSWFSVRLPPRGGATANVVISDIAIQVCQCPFEPQARRGSRP